MNRRTFLGSLLGLLGLSKGLVAEEKKAIPPVVPSPKKELIQHGWVFYEEIGIVLTDPIIEQKIQLIQHSKPVARDYSNYNGWTGYTG